MPWYSGSIWTALTEALGESDRELKARAEMNMPECQRCRSFQADLDSQQRQHDLDEVGWLEVVAEKDRKLAEQAVLIEKLKREATIAKGQEGVSQGIIDALRQQLRDER